jgi:hypothetical protein
MSMSNFSSTERVFRHRQQEFLGITGRGDACLQHLLASTT